MMKRPRPLARRAPFPRRPQLPHRHAGEGCRPSDARWPARLRRPRATRSSTPSTATATLVVEPSFEPGDVKLPDLPRFGMQAKLVVRLRAARLVRPRPARDLRRPPRAARRRATRRPSPRTTSAYSQPQETGNKVDVRWATVRNGSGAGLLVDRPAAPLGERTAPPCGGDGPGRPPPPAAAATPRPGSTSTRGRWASAATTAGAPCPCRSTACPPAPNQLPLPPAPDRGTDASPMAISKLAMP